MASKSHANYMRNRDWYIKRETSESGKTKRVIRDQAREAEIKAGKIKRGSPLTVDHVKPLSKGGTDARSNLRIVSGKANRQKFNHT